METLWNDIRYALRTFRANPGLTAVAVLSLAIGIGPNAAVFSLIDGLGFRPLPIRDPASLLVVSSVTPKERAGEASYAEYLELRDGVPAFASVAAQATQGVSIAGGTQGPSLGFAGQVSASYFATLGVAPVAGRTFLSGEDHTPGTHPVAIISERLWVKRYGRDPQILGRTIRLNRVDCAIVGVMPASFRGTTPPYGPDLWVPLVLSSSLWTAPASVTDPRDARRLTLFARLGPQATLSQAQAAVDALASHLAEAYPDTNRDRRFTIEYEEAQRRGSFTSFAVVSLAVVGLVLLIACANVAGLLLGRAEARRGEIAMRLALGATRGRLVRQLLTESAVLSLMAAVAGLALTFGFMALLPALVPPTPVTPSFDFRLDPRVLVFTLTVALLAAPVFGLTPALLASRPDILPVLKGDSGASRFGSRRFHPRSVLVVGQIALSLALLALSGLLLRSYFNTYRLDPGFVPRPMIFATLAPQTVGYNDAQSLDLYRRLLDRLAAVPGVEQVSMASNLPLDSMFGGGAKLNVAIPGHEPPAGEEAFSFRSSAVEPGYFDTMGIRLLEGRDFAAGDRTGAAGAVIVNQTFARRFWPQGDPIGQGMRLLSEGSAGSVTECQIVGVVQDVKHHSFGETPAPYSVPAVRAGDARPDDRHRTRPGRSLDGGRVQERTRGDRPSDARAACDHDRGVPAAGIDHHTSGCLHSVRGQRHWTVPVHDRPLWSDLVLRHAGPARDRNPHRARSTAGRRGGASPRTGRPSGSRRQRHRPGIGCRGCVGVAQCALRRQRDGSCRLRRRDVPGDRRGPGGILPARPARGALLIQP